MISQEVLLKIKGLELKVKRLLQGGAVGDFTTAQKGSGFEFNQLRDYQEGDDIRFIDWKSSAKMNKLIVRQYLEERNRIIWLALDVSESLRYGSGEFLKQEILAQTAAIIALVAEYGKDSIGLIFFAAEASVVLPPARGRSHSKKLIEKLFAAEAQPGLTSFEALLTRLTLCVKRKSIIIIVSDFIGLEDDCLKKIKALAFRHECLAICLHDEREIELPKGVVLDLEDSETSERLMISTTRSNKDLLMMSKQEHARLKQCAFSFLNLSMQKNSIEDLVLFFKHQMMY